MGKLRPEIVAAFCGIPTTASVLVAASLQAVFPFVCGVAESGRAAMLIIAARTAAGRISLVNSITGREQRWSLDRITLAHFSSLLRYVIPADPGTTFYAGYKGNVTPDCILSFLRTDSGILEITRKGGRP